MTITLTQKEYRELWAETCQNSPQQLETQLFYEMPKQLRLQLFPILAEQDQPQLSPRLKAETIARIDYARELLLSRLENPPSLLELAQMVGVSDACGGLRLRTLRRGFKELLALLILITICNNSSCACSSHS